MRSCCQRAFEACVVCGAVALLGVAPAPSPSPVSSEVPVRATVACSVLVEHARLKEPPKVMTPELFGSLEAAALRIHGVTFEPGSGVTKRQLLEAEADVLGCLGL